MSKPRGKNIEAIYRLSPLQEGVLFHTLQAARAGVYFQQYSCRLPGAVDEARLREAWDMVVARHPVMRTLFSWERGDKPLQIVRERVTLPMRSLDWRDKSRAERELAWADFLVCDRETGFALDRAPLSRVALCRFGEQDYRLLWSFHHLLIDGWSMRLLMHELRRCYAGAAAALAPAGRYADFIAWLERRDAGAAQVFWRDYLRGFTAPSNPPPAPDPDPDGAVHATVELRLPAELSASLSELTRRERLTLNSVVAGAWAVTLARHCASTDVVFGTTVAGRPTDLEAGERTAGLFINSLPLRLRLDAPLAVADWLRSLQSAQAQARAFEQTPLVEIQRVSELAPGNALFDTLLVFENFPAGDEADDGAAALPGADDEQYIEYSNYPLAILAVPGERLRLLAVHDPRWYGAEAVHRLLRHLQSALAAFAQDATRDVRRVALCEPAERERQLVQWNATEVAFEPASCVHELFESQARRTPAAVAVAFEDQSLSYAELDARANRLANYLCREGVGPGSYAALFLERSPEAVVALLAVLKAGAAYVPLDPAFPGERVRLVLDDLGAGGKPPLLLTSEPLCDRLPRSALRRFCLDRDWPLVAGEPPVPPRLARDPAQLAYLIYTSGSTGRPKGVMVSHANLLNSTRARPQYYPERLSAFLLLSSLATDSSVAGVFWALCTGATLVLPRTRQEQDVAQLAGLIARHQVSHFLCVPSLYLAILESADSAQLNSLSAVLLAGEACSAEVVLRHRATLPASALYNEYGPTEGTVWATVSRLDTLSAVRRIPIGTPIANARVYVLDEALNPLPVGLRGELFIGGAGVAAGYLNQSELTAERFLPDPFSDDPRSRIYRSGDLVHFDDDGALIFDGRRDQQIKIRGYRIELAEIEQVLAQHPAVAEVVVAADSGQSAAVAAHDPSALAAALSALAPGQAERLLESVLASQGSAGEPMP